MLERSECTWECSSGVCREQERMSVCLCPGSKKHMVCCVMGVNKEYDVGVAGVALF